MSAAAARRTAALALVLALALALAASAAAAPALNGSFPVKGVDTNSKIVAGPDGNMWVTITGATNNVAKITPAGGVEEFALGLQNVEGIAAGREGKLWVTGTNTLASFSPSDPKGTVSETTIISIAGNSPIVVGPDGNLWVATKDTVLRIPPGNPKASTPFAVAGLDPKDIDVAGSLLAVSDASVKNRIATLTTAGVEKDFTIPGASQGLAGGPNGQIAFSAAGANPERVGLISPPNPPTLSELLNDPFGVALGVDQAYWIVQFSGQVTRMTTSGVKTTAITGLPKESPRQIAAGPGNTMWVTLSKNEGEGVARISGLEPPAPPPPPKTAPETKIAKGPGKVVRTSRKRAEVKFRFGSTTAGVKFECALTKVKKLKKGQQTPKPEFKGCQSPKSLKLKPGKYRFWVRAVNAGVADPTPAKSSFRVVRVHRHRR